MNIIQSFLWTMICDFMIYLTWVLKKYFCKEAYVQCCYKYLHYTNFFFIIPSHILLWFYYIFFSSRVWQVKTSVRTNSVFILIFYPTILRLIHETQWLNKYFTKVMEVFFFHKILKIVISKITVATLLLYLHIGDILEYNKKCINGAKSH